MTKPLMVSDEPLIQAHYETCLENGCTHALAQALAFREGPAIRTDVTLLQGHSNGNQFARNPALGEAYAARARAAGIPTQGKIYLSGLAAFPGDPEAWVSDRSDVQRVLERRNWSASGVVNRQTEERGDPPVLGHPTGVAEDILQEELSAMIAEDPDIAPTPREKLDLREKLLNERKPHWVK